MIASKTKDHVKQTLFFCVIFLPYSSITGTPFKTVCLMPYTNAYSR